MTWRVIVHKDPLRFDTTDLLIIEHGAMSGERRLIKAVEFETPQRHLLAEPTLRIEDERMDELLQAFADAAWERGIRPRQIEDQRNQVAAMNDHLADLRRVVFKQLKID